MIWTRGVETLTRRILTINSTLIGPNIVLQVHNLCVAKVALNRTETASLFCRYAWMLDRILAADQ